MHNRIRWGDICDRFVTDIVDVVVGMDWLAVNHTEILCFKKIIKVLLTHGGTIMIYGENGRKATTIISLLKAGKYVAKGCSSYLAYVVDAKLEKKGVTDIDVVREFSDVLSILTGASSGIPY